MLVISEIAFPNPGTWSIEPFCSRLIVRSPTSTAPPVVEPRAWSKALPDGCAPDEVSELFHEFAQAFNAGDGARLKKLLDSSIDFSVSDEGVRRVAVRTVEEVARYVEERHRAGERVYPYLIFTALADSPGRADAAVYFVREAPDLPSPAGPRVALAGSQLDCAHGQLVRFNSDLLRK